MYFLIYVVSVQHILTTCSCVSVTVHACQGFIKKEGRFLLNKKSEYIIAKELSARCAETIFPNSLTNFLALYSFTIFTCKTNYLKAENPKKIFNSCTSLKCIAVNEY